MIAATLALMLAGACPSDPPTNCEISLHKLILQQELRADQLQIRLNAKTRTSSAAIVSLPPPKAHNNELILLGAGVASGAAIVSTLIAVILLTK